MFSNFSHTLSFFCKGAAVDTEAALFAGEKPFFLPTMITITANTMSRKRFYLIGIALISSAFLSIAEVPAGYYDSAVGKSGNALQEALSDLIGDKELGYDNLWEAYRTTDRRDDGKVWDMYSSTTDFVFGSDQCGSYSREGDCYNREHSVPKSWLGGRKYFDAQIGLSNAVRDEYLALVDLYKALGGGWGVERSE